MSKPMSRRAMLTAGLAATSTVLVARAASADVTEGLPTPREDDDTNVEFHDWSAADRWNEGQADGVTVEAAGRASIVLDQAVDTVDYTDPHTGQTSSWEIATWTSQWQELSAGASEAIASWNVDTPSGTWLQIELAGRYDDGVETGFFVMGRWASGEDDIRRTSVDGQGDDRTTIYTDTFSVDDSDAHRVTAVRVRLTLHRKPGTDLTPRVWRVGVMGSVLPDRFEVPATQPGVATGVELDVPRYSQSIHAGEYPEYGGGGEAWCSPTSSQMIIESFGREPKPEDLEWVDPDIQDPQVCHAARSTYDAQYDGCGNWPFNAAYAASYEDMDAIVTRISSLADAEALIAAGFPLITSQSFLAEELDGAGYGTAGHLMTVIGFTEDGDVIANDPASPTNDAVRHVYDRRQFENIWLRTKRYDANGNVASGTGGVCYLYKPTDMDWPSLPGVPGAASAC